jgi:molybdenum cofactor cytidylyltransferase
MIATKTGSPPTLRIVVLAAGLSTRLGQAKALSRVHGVTLLARTLGALAPFAKASKIIVVIPPGAARYKIGSSAKTVMFVANRQRASGLSTTVRAGLQHARYSAAALLLPVDLAELASADIARLIARWRGARRRVAARRVHEGPGAPLILPHWLYVHTCRLAGDRGLRDIVRALPHDLVSLVTMPSAASDVDTPQDLERARRRFRFWRSGPGDSRRRFR